MSIKVTCAKCGARLVYKGTAAMVKPCPKCQTPIAFDPAQPEPAPLPPVAPVAEEPITAVAVDEPESRPAAATKEIAAAPSKRSAAVVLIALGGLAAAFGGLCLLILACAGIAVFLHSSDRKEAMASDSKGQPFSAVSGVGYTESSYSPSPAYDYAAAPSASGSATDTAAAAAEQARLEEEQRRLGVEAYYAELEAEQAAREEAEERYQEAFRETFRIREAYP